MLMSLSKSSLYLGSCTWNYDSWVGLLYDKSSPTAAGYLEQYSKHFNSVEIDSWFYRIPTRKDVLAYKKAVGPDFRFTCKVPQEICLTHRRGHKKEEAPEPNPNFLSLDLLQDFLDTVSPLTDQIDAFMFEFEYLNKQKMASLDAFLEKLDEFFAEAPTGLPYALEPRNSNYLKTKYFQFVKKQGLIHVLSEKIYLPHIYDVYDEFSAYFGDTVVIRLLGGDRKEMEERADNQWDKIVDPKSADLPRIVRMISEMMQTKKKVFINVNNHYEGSAPLTMKKIASSLGRDQELLAS
jgi:uncharacterized protein YecE (DUF72 family)